MIPAIRRCVRFSARILSPLTCRFGLLVIFSFIAFVQAVSAQSQSVVSVSAASYDPNALTPDSIAAAFGPKLATQTAAAQTLPLPTTLGGTTVRVNGNLAGLFYVSPGQVNYLIPASITPGTAAVQVIAGDGTTSNGTIQVQQAAAAMFTATADGSGVPAAYLTRVTNGKLVDEPVSELDANNKPIPKAINPGLPGDRVFLILFLTGVRGTDDPNKDGNLNENVHVLMGGRELTPDYVGKHASFVGIDQINLELPRDLFGLGRFRARSR